MCNLLINCKVYSLHSLHQRRAYVNYSNPTPWDEHVEQPLTYLMFHLLLQKWTSFEAWFRYKPDLQHLKIFGYLCFTYVPQVKRDKLDKKAKLEVFIGYNNSSKTYKIFQPQNEKILVNRDVNFMKDNNENERNQKRSKNRQQRSRNLQLGRLLTTILMMSRSEVQDYYLRFMKVAILLFVSLHNSKRQWRTTNGLKQLKRNLEWYKKKWYMGANGQTFI